MQLRSRDPYFLWVGKACTNRRNHFAKCGTHVSRIGHIQVQNNLERPDREDGREDTLDYERDYDLGQVSSVVQHQGCSWMKNNVVIHTPNPATSEFVDPTLSHAMSGASVIQTFAVFQFNGGVEVLLRGVQSGGGFRGCLQMHPGHGKSCSQP